MKRSGVLTILICIMLACAVTVGVSIVRTPGDDPVNAFFSSAEQLFFALNLRDEMEKPQDDLTSAQETTTLEPAATDVPEATQPAATMQPQSTLPAQTGETQPAVETMAQNAEGNIQQPEASATAAESAAPEQSMQPEASATAAESAAPEQSMQPEASAAAIASAAPEQSAQPVGIVQSQSAESVTMSSGDSFGTPEELNESTPKFNYSVLAAQTGLDPEVLAKMYTPFYVLDIAMDEVYYPLTSPGGSAGSNKIYGGQVGVDVVSIDGDYAFINAYRYPGGRAIEGYVPVKKLKQITPDDRYSIIIDKRQQRLFLFEYGELKADMYCSSGKTTSETPAGEFVKYGTKHTIYSDADPDIAYYGVRLNGRVYIHSVSHISGDYSKAISMLGRKASHGCVRVPLDWAEWFYENIPDGTKIIITEYRGDTPPLGEGGRDGD